MDVTAAGGWCSPSDTVFDLHADYDSAAGLTIGIPEVMARRAGPIFEAKPLVYTVKPIDEFERYTLSVGPETSSLISQYVKAMAAEQARLQAMVPPGYIVVLSTPRMEWDENKATLYWEVVEDGEYEGWDD